MADLGALFSVTQQLIKALKSAELKEICSNSQLEELHTTVSAIRVAIKVAEARQGESERVLLAERSWLGSIRDHVYAADDLIDELLTQRRTEVRHSLFTHKIQRLEKVKKKMDIFANEWCNYNNSRTTDFSVNYLFIRMMRQKTCSYAYVEDYGVIGRKDELKTVVHMLLHPNVEHEDDCSVLAIEGLGGIGKTTLIQLVYNDDRIKLEFPLRFWESLSDISNRRQFNVKAILSNILQSGTKPHQRLPPADVLSMQDLEHQFQKMFGRNKTLLVLDNVWIGHANHHSWIQLRDCFGRNTGGGSRIVVATHSVSTARIVSCRPGDTIFQLNGLSKDDSWNLFERIAFQRLRDNNQVPTPEFVELGKKIVQKCINVPLAIKVVGGILYGLHIGQWELFQESVPAKNVTEILKLSYSCLNFPLKSCFSYCASFPREFVMDKKMLIRLWMAQGYIVPNKEGQSFEDAGEEYVSIFVRGGLFEVVERDSSGEVVSCKIEDLMYGIAEEAAAKAFCYGHIFQSREQPTGYSFSKVICIRSCVRAGFNQLPLDTLVQWRSLRTLDLHGLEIKKLPVHISELLHLRYLDLSHNKYLEALPTSLVKLCNLQTLDLRCCALLKELPQGFGMLSRLRYLDIFGCDGLTHLPSGMDKLTCLRMLSHFVVAEGISGDKEFCAETRDLRRLVNLRGDICISIPKAYTHVKRLEWRGGCLDGLKHLQGVWVRFVESHSADNYDQRIVNYHQALMEKFQPHRNLIKLMIWGYQGAIISKWGRAEDNWADTLPHLVKIELRSCDKLQRLPFLSKLPHLKALILNGLRELEYLEPSSCGSSSDATETPTFFPSLEELEILNAPKLKGFWDGTTIPNYAHFPPRLVRIELRSCEKLQHLPLLSKLSLLKSLKLYGLSNLECLGEKLSSKTNSAVPDSELTFLSSLEELEIVNAPKLRGCWMVVRLTDINRKASPATSCLTSLKSLMLANLPELTGFFCQQDADTDGTEEIQHDNHQYTLQFGCLTELRVSHCPKLMFMPDVPSLESLEAINVNLELLNNLLCSSASSRLHKVNIVSVHGLHSLPDSLSNVKSLAIRRCEDLDSLAMGTLASIKQLTLQECGRLKRLFPWLNYFFCLEELEIKDCEEVVWNIKDEGNGGSYVSPLLASLCLKNLHSLKLTNISKCESLIGVLGHIKKLRQLSLSWLYNLRALPDNVELLAHLRHLTIRSCPNLTVLPDSLGSLASLELLEIESCSRLKQLPDSLLTGSFQVVIRDCPNLSLSQ